MTPPYKPAAVRPDYLAGVWDYARGKPASEHRDYARAVALAEFDPWWIRNYNDVAAVLDGCYFDEQAAKEAASFFPLLCHTLGEFAGKPFHLMDWQEWDLVRPLFGWKTKTGARRFAEAHVEVPKKQGKSSLCAALGLYLMFGDGEHGAEVYAGATTRDQAAIVHKEAARMARGSEHLSRRFRCIDHRKTIYHDASNSFFRALSADVESAEGLNIHGAIIDELHVHKNRLLYDTLKHGGSARRQPLMIAITTAGIYDPTSIGWEQHDYARKILDGMVDDTKFFAYIAGATDEDDWRDPAVWKRANPSWGVTINTERALGMIAEAESKPAAVNGLKRYRLNIWTRQSVAWMQPDIWSACAADYNESDLAGMECYAGMDLSQSDDLTALVLWFPPQHGLETNRVLPYFWLPSDTIREHDRYYGGLYSTWANAGKIILTPGDVIDYQAVRGKIEELNQLFRIECLYYDRAFAASLVQDLQVDGMKLMEHPQTTAAMNSSVTDIMTLTKKRELEHPDHPVLNWHIGNAQAFSDYGGRVKIQKLETSGRKKSPKRLKVDGAVAMAMARTGAATHEPAGDYYIGA